MDSLAQMKRFWKKRIFLAKLGMYAFLVFFGFIAFMFMCFVLEAWRLHGLGALFKMQADYYWSQLVILPLLFSCPCVFFLPIACFVLLIKKTEILFFLFKYSLFGFVVGFFSMNLIEFLAGLFLFLACGEIKGFIFFPINLSLLGIILGPVLGLIFGSVKIFQEKQS